MIYQKPWKLPANDEMGTEDKSALADFSRALKVIADSKETILMLDADISRIIQSLDRKGVKQD